MLNTDVDIKDKAADIISIIDVVMTSKRLENRKFWEFSKVGENREEIYTFKNKEALEFIESVIVK